MKCAMSKITKIRSREILDSRGRTDFGDDI
jgi:hypothetical protein